VKKAMNWTTRERRVQGVIRCYDLRAAGLSAARELDLIPEAEFSRLMGLPKKQRQVAVGKMYREDPAFGSAVEARIAEAMSTFISENGLAQEDIISVKRDAVYSKKPCSSLSVGEFLSFRESAKFSSFVKAPGLEFYYSSWDNTYEVKGISPERLVLHSGFMLDALIGIMSTAEQDDKSLVVMRARKLHEDYVTASLPVGFYRELNPESMFRFEGKIGTLGLLSDSAMDLESIDHRYNLMVMIEFFGNLLGD
jgi:hypothetical protein